MIRRSLRLRSCRCTCRAAQRSISGSLSSSPFTLVYFGEDIALRQQQREEATRQMDAAPNRCGGTASLHLQVIQPNALAPVGSHFEAELRDVFCTGRFPFGAPRGAPSPADLQGYVDRTVWVWRRRGPRRRGSLDPPIEKQRCAALGSANTAGRTTQAMFCEAMNLIICILSISAVATLAAPLLARKAVAAGVGYLFGAAHQRPEMLIRFSQGLVPNKVQDSAVRATATPLFSSMEKLMLAVV